jgi:hypothetical protein
LFVSTNASKSMRTRSKMPIAVRFFGPADARLRETVEQHARRVRAAGEQVLVEQRHFQERNLQAAEHRLHFGRQVSILQDVFEQKAHEVDRVLVGARDVRAGFAAQLAGLAEEFLLDLERDLRRFRRALRRQVLVLQDRQRRQQLGNIERGDVRIVVDGRVAGRDAGRGRAVDVGAPVREHRAQRAVEVRLQFGRRRVDGQVARARAAVEAVGHLLGHRRAGYGGCAGRTRRRCRRAGPALHGRPHLRQHAGVHEQRVQLVVERVEPAHDVAVEKFVDDQAHRQLDLELAAGLAERLADGRRSDRAVGVLDALVRDVRKTLVQREQHALQTVFGFRDHARDGERFFEFGVVDERQRQLAGRIRFGFAADAAAGDEVDELARELFLEAQLDLLALLAHLAHAVEIRRLHGVAVGLARKVEQRVVGVLEQRRGERREALERVRAHLAEGFGRAFAERRGGRALIQIHHFGIVVVGTHRPHDNRFSASKPI